MMEWKVTYRRDLVTEKGVEGENGMTYLRVVPKAATGRDMFKKLLSVFFWLIDGSWVTGMAIVLVHGLGGKAEVPLLEYFSPIERESDLRGSGDF